jgi:uncharacterized protein (UPF0210 family)
MLPVLEDIGIAQASAQGRFDVTDLLAYSSVCGVGVDMVPVSGNVSVQQIESLMFDLSTVSLRLNKPLSARLLPVLGKDPGEMTSFESKYMCNSVVMKI